MAPQAHAGGQWCAIIGNGRQDELTCSHGGTMVRNARGQPHDGWRRPGSCLALEYVHVACAVVKSRDPAVMKREVRRQLAFKALARQRRRRLFNLVVVVVPVEVQARIRHINAAFLALYKIRKGAVVVSVHPCCARDLERSDRFCAIRVEVVNPCG